MPTAAPKTTGKPGRKPLTEEQKAERKAAREAALSFSGISRVSGFTTTDGQAHKTLKTAQQHQARISFEAFLDEQDPGSFGSSASLTSFILTNRHRLLALLRAIPDTSTAAD